MADDGQKTQWPTRKGLPPDDWGRNLPCGCDPDTGIECDTHLREILTPVRVVDRAELLAEYPAPSGSDDNG